MFFARPNSITPNLVSCTFIKGTSEAYVLKLLYSLLLNSHLKYLKAFNLRTYFRNFISFIWLDYTSCICTIKVAISTVFVKPIQSTSINNLYQMLEFLTRTTKAWSKNCPFLQVSNIFFKFLPYSAAVFTTNCLHLWN